MAGRLSLQFDKKFAGDFVAYTISDDNDDHKARPNTCGRWVRELKSYNKIGDVVRFLNENIKERYQAN